MRVSETGSQVAPALRLATSVTPTVSAPVVSTEAEKNACILRGYATAAMSDVPAHTIGSLSIAADSVRSVMPNSDEIAPPSRYWNSAIDARVTMSCGQNWLAVHPPVIERLRSHSTLLQYRSVPVTSVK